MSAVDVERLERRIETRRRIAATLTAEAERLEANAADLRQRAERMLASAAELEASR